MLNCAIHFVYFQGVPEDKPPVLTPSLEKVDLPVFKEALPKYKNHLSATELEEWKEWIDKVDNSLNAPECATWSLDNLKLFKRPNMPVQQPIQNLEGLIDKELQPCSEVHVMFINNNINYGTIHFKIFVHLC
jgi:hypothetical protein